MMNEVSRNEIATAIELWNQTHLSKLKLPEQQTLLAGQE
jgi:hypothetical protein